MTYFVSPSVFYHDSETGLYMNPKNAPNYSQNTFPGVTIKLDGVRLDITGVSQDLDDEYTEELTTVQANSDNYIYGFVTNSISSPDVEVQALF